MRIATTICVRMARPTPTSSVRWRTRVKATRTAVANRTDSTVVDSGTGRFDLTSYSSGDLSIVYQPLPSTTAAVNSAPELDFPQLELNWVNPVERDWN